MSQKIVEIRCRGIDKDGVVALQDAILVRIRLIKSPGARSGLISVGPEGCPHNTGDHGQRCKASHPTMNKISDEDDVFCPFSFDLPFARESAKGFTVPRKLRAAVAELEAKKY